jgi:hypothetical protein
LALLKDIQYQPSGNVSDGIPINRGRFTEIIAECLSEIGAYSTFFSGSDTPVKYAVDWYHSDMASLNNCPMFTSGVRRFLFKQKNTEADIGYEPISCYEVLEIILKAWNARIILTNGQFLVEQSASHINTLRREWDLTVDGSTSGTVASENNTRTIDQTNVIRLAGGSRSWQKALKSVTKTGVHNSYENLLQQRINYDTIFYDFNPENVSLSIGSTDEKTLRIRIPIQLTIFNRTTTDYNFQGNYVAMILGIRLDDGAGTSLYLNKEIFQNDSTMTWTGASSTSYYRFGIELPTQVEQDQFITVEKIIDIETPSFTNEGLTDNTISLRFQPLDTLYASNAPSSSYTLSTLNTIQATDNQYDPTYSGDLLMWYSTGFSTIQLNGGSEQPSNEIEFTVSDSTSTAIETYDYGDIQIGTIYRSSVELSAINVYDGSVWTIPGAGWDQGALSGTYKFNVLGSRELLDLRNTTRSRQNFTIQGTINANNSIAYNSDKYVFMGGQFVANLDRWSGEWLEVPSTSSLTGFTSVEDVLGIPGTLNVGSTVSNVDELAGQVAGVLQSGSITGVSSGIAQGTVITGIDIEDYAQSAIVNSGDEITVISASTGQSQSFTVTADVTSGDTTISVSSATTEFEIQEGDFVAINQLDLIKKLTDEIGAVDFENLPDVGTLGVNKFLRWTGSEVESQYLFYYADTGFAISEATGTGETNTVQFVGNTPEISTSASGYELDINFNSVNNDGWTPIVNVGSGSVTLGTTTTKAVKNGQIATVSARIPIASASSPSLSLNVSGLPYFAEISSGHYVVVIRDAVSGQDFFYGNLENDGLNTLLTISDEASSIVANELQTGSIIEFAITYQTTGPNDDENYAQYKYRVETDGGTLYSSQSCTESEINNLKSL